MVSKLEFNINTFIKKLKISSLSMHQFYIPSNFTPLHNFRVTEIKQYFTIFYSEAEPEKVQQHCSNTGWKVKELGGKLRAKGPIFLIMFQF